MIINKSDSHKWLYLKVIWKNDISKMWYIKNDYKFSSNINEVIKTVLNFLIFFTKGFHKYKEAQNHLQRTNIKNVYKNIKVVI